MMNVYRLTYVNPAFAPRPSYEVVDAHNAQEATRAFWSRVNPAGVVKTAGDGGICAIERQVIVIDGRTQHGRTEWRQEGGAA